MRRLFWIVLVLIGSAAPASAQIQRPLPPVVVDVRSFFTGLGQDPTTATGLGVTATALPKRALGTTIGVHVYPLRKSTFALGLGGEFVRARGSAGGGESSSTTTPAAPRIEQRLSGLSGGISLNFGRRDGWSYLTAGMGPMSFSAFQGATAPTVTPPKKSTINMGGGARWFATPRVAFTFDVRFYLTRPEVIVDPYPGRSRNRLRILSAGIAIR